MNAEKDRYLQQSGEKSNYLVIVFSGEIEIQMQYSKKTTDKLLSEAKAPKKNPKELKKMSSKKSTFSLDKKETLILYKLRKGTVAFPYSFLEQNANCYSVYVKENSVLLMLSKEQLIDITKDNRNFVNQITSITSELKSDKFVYRGDFLQNKSFTKKQSMIKIAGSKFEIPNIS